MSAVNLNISTDSVLQSKAQAVLDELGLDMSTAVNIFLEQVVSKEAIPFRVERVVKSERSEVMGSLKGKIWMADDFDAPLEEMSEYM
ncbi:MAG: type II toxin-antitoxin system RelB/DinJ family antitoxin [Deferribacteraceae bacterium]|jgi:DNA-damage-inducible protein J|nr:type II toxin-antitoxin system RelB/DinJ family antitoxin [Deferribacteraceae bacterium]